MVARASWGEGRGGPASMSAALRSSESTFCSAPIASCTAPSKGSGSAPLIFFSRKLTASWSFAPAEAACPPPPRAPPHLPRPRISN